MSSNANHHDHNDHERASDEGTRRVDPIIGEGRLIGARRQAVEQQCQRLAVRITELDAQLLELSRQRRTASRELKQHHRRLWPALLRRGRRPGPDGAVQLPPVPADARFLWGRRLRSACVALLSRLGETSLPELHAVLHRLGYAIAGSNTVKALADALGYEHDAGRACRVSRGVYAVPPGAPIPARLWRGGPPLPYITPNNT